MALSDIKKLADYAKRHEDKIKDEVNVYDWGSSSMVHVRGNILLGKRRYVKSLKVNGLRKFLMDNLF